jgi:hypothetical protein
VFCVGLAVGVVFAATFSLYWSIYLTTGSVTVPVDKMVDGFGRPLFATVFWNLQDRGAYAL